MNTLTKRQKINRRRKERRRRMIALIKAKKNGEQQVSQTPPQGSGDSARAASG